MNRRELFKAVVGVAAAFGVAVKASVIEEPEKRPALAVFELPGILSADACARIQEQWTHMTTGTPFEGVKAVILMEGMKLTMLAEDGSVLNRTIEG